VPLDRLLDAGVAAGGEVQQVRPAPHQCLHLGVRRVGALVHLGADQRDQLRPLLLLLPQVLRAGLFAAGPDQLQLLGREILLHHGHPLDGPEELVGGDLPRRA
jgi:hypothetical protein